MCDLRQLLSNNPDDGLGAGPTLDLVDAVASPCGQLDEDRAGRKHDAAWVLDGATPVRASEAGTPQSGAVQLVAHADAALRRCLDAPTVRDAVRASLVDVRESFFVDWAAAFPGRPDRTLLPSACLAFVRVGERAGGLQLEHLLLGDASIVVHGAGGTVVVGGDEGLDQEQRHLAAVGAGQALEARLRERRATMNTPDGYWIYADEPAAADHALSGTVPVAEGDLVLLASDGFARLVDMFGRYDWPALLETAVADGLDALVDELRAVERADRDRTRFPRIKRSDDATAVLLRVTAGSGGVTDPA